MALICNSRLLKDANIDGHALCPAWDSCRGFLLEEYPCQWDGRVSACIAAGLASVPHNTITLAEVRATD